MIAPSVAMVKDLDYLPDGMLGPDAGRSERLDDRLTIGPSYRPNAASTPGQVRHTCSTVPRIMASTSLAIRSMSADPSDPKELDGWV
jgi:hypothetical protein